MKSHHLLLVLGTLALASCQTASPDHANQSELSPKRFDLADLNHDGSLTHDEVSDYLVTSVFTARDASKDGKMTTAEWVVSNDAGEIKNFKARDLNGDGAVTLAEAKAYARKVGSFEATVKEADTNKDRLVSRAEVAAYYASKEGPVR
jgi:hypothetical protein